MPGSMPDCLGSNMNNKLNIRSSAHSALLRRLLAKDTTLWSADSEISAAIQNRLGWLDVLSFSFTQVQRLEQFRHRIRTEDFDQAILLGMGGSSLAPEVLAQCLHPGDSINLTVLDTTFPDAIQRVTTMAARGKPLFIVSSKSGTTAETMALRTHFWHWTQARYGSAAGHHFIAITDAQSSLHQLAQEHDYAEIFLNPADIGGRFSALSLFGLVPASLLGVDIVSLLNGARGVYSDGPKSQQALHLGILMGEASLQGRDKLTLTFSPKLIPLGAWIEQLVAESTGKQGKGIIPIIGESVAPPDHYGRDRVFINIAMNGHARGNNGSPDWFDELEKLGHPVLHGHMDDMYEIGAEFAKWQIATAIACAIIGVNPFDEPDVNATKTATNELLQEPIQVASAVGRGSTLKQQLIDLEQFLSGVGTKDYIAILAYLPADNQFGEALHKLRGRIGHLTKCATCSSFGPRYLHSSGQLHKGGPKNGHFLFLTATASQDIQVPKQNYGFQQLISAQAHGDIAVLKQRGQKVLHIHLGPVTAAAKTILHLTDQLTS